MSYQVEFPSTTKTAITTIVCAVFVVLLLMGLKRLRSSEVLPPSSLDRVSSKEDSDSSRDVLAEVSDGTLILPIVQLEITDASREVNWSASLAHALNGLTEVSVEGGRVDVLTDRYAIEVDRLEKWHEAIGQAAHYGIETGKTAVAAIIIPSDSWPLPTHTRETIGLIERTCLQQSVKLVLLRRSIEGNTGVPSRAVTPQGE